MSVRRIDGAWYVDIRWNGRRYRRKSPVNDRRGAEAHQVQLRQVVEKLGYLPEEAKPAAVVMPTFDVFADEWLATYVRTNLKPTTRHLYERVVAQYLRPRFAGIPLSGIDGKTLETFKAELVAAGKHPKTINSFLSVIRRCLTSAQDWGTLENIPRFRWLKVPPPEFDFLSFSESDALLAAATESPWRRMIYLALRTGMRLGELLGLRWEDIDLERRMIAVRRSRTRGWEQTPKNNRIRYIPIASDLAAELERAQSPSGQVIAGPGGLAVTEPMARYALRRARRRAGLRHFGWHVLRHTFASQLAMAGVPVQAIQSFLGHSTIQMTMRYAHLAPSAFRGAVELLRNAELQERTGGGAQRDIPSLGSGMGSRNPIAA